MSENLSGLREEIKNHREDIKDVYSRLDNHNGRIVSCEVIQMQLQENQKEIKDEIISFKKDMNQTCKEIQGCVNRFIEDINGIPKRNKIDLLEHNDRIKILENKNLKQDGFLSGISKATVIYWTLISALAGVIIFLLQKYVFKV